MRSRIRMHIHMAVQQILRLKRYGSAVWNGAFVAAIPKPIHFRVVGVWREDLIK